MIRFSLLFTSATTRASGPALTINRNPRSPARAGKISATRPCDGISAARLSFSPRPSSKAKTFAVPRGAIAIGIGRPINPLATSLIVPSPPAATTTSTDSTSNSEAIVVACPGPSVRRRTTSWPRARKCFKKPRRRPR